MSRSRVFAALAFGALLFAQPAFASFHLMQIEQVIGGVNGDTTRQAIMLRMRANGQNLVQQARLQAWDATGANPILLVDLGVSVPNALAGDHILIATANFLPGLTPDFVMTNPIPASYLAAGKLTFEQDDGSVYWALAWGGATYTGTNTGVTVGGGGNDPDGNFNPPFAGPMPSRTPRQCASRARREP